MREAWLIRHGESEGNAGLVTISPRKICLTSRGQMQAESVAKAFNRAPSLIVTSAYIRTRQTAEPTIRRFPTVPVVEWDVQEFTYLDLERYRSTTVFERRPHVESYWNKCDPEYCDGTGAESFNAFFRRVELARELLCVSTLPFIAVFSHSMFIRGFMWSLTDSVSQTDAPQMLALRNYLSSFEMANASILKLQIDRDRIALVTGEFEQSYMSR
jgi:broad specificity phosphatase PhoE